MTIAFFMLLGGIAVVLALEMNKQLFPYTPKTSSEVNLTWSNNIDLAVNKRRAEEMIKLVDSLAIHTEVEIGGNSFISSSNGNSPQTLKLYINYPSPFSKRNGDSIIFNYLKSKFEYFDLEIKPAPTPFDALFYSSSYKKEIRLRDISNLSEMDIAKKRIIESKVWQMGPEFNIVKAYNLNINEERCYTQGISPEDFQIALSNNFGETFLEPSKDYGVSQIVVKSKNLKSIQRLMNSRIKIHNVSIMVGDFVSINESSQAKCISNDELGRYYSIFTNAQGQTGILDSDFGLFTIHGAEIEADNIINELLLVMGISLFMLFFILAIEFESFVQPLIILSSIPISFCGSLLFVNLFIGQFDLMSGIGLMIVLGLLDNDSILKIDAINRFKKRMPLDEAIFLAGKDRLKPIVVNTCTNISTIFPLLFVGGLGSDLQKPVVYALIGGLIFSTFVSLFYVPFLVWFTENKKKNLVNPLLL
jgi:multidrug efflux pump subunit AcrB